MNYKTTEKQKKNKHGDIVGIEKRVVADMLALTEQERKAVELLVASGYKLVPRKPKKESGKGLTKQKMLDYLKEKDAKGYEVAKRKMENKENYMRILKWFKENYKDYLV